MAIETKNVLKTYFETGAKPTEEQFSTLIDSLLHVNELVNLNLVKASQLEAEAGIVDDRYMTPLKVKQAVDLAINNLKDGVTTAYDTLKEIADYIANDETLGSALTQRIADLESGKIDKSSIVNDLTTGGTTKVLSAEQGKVLNSYILHNFGTDASAYKTGTDKNNNQFYTYQFELTARDGLEQYSTVFGFFRTHSSEGYEQAVNIVSGNVFIRKYRSGIGWSSWRQIDDKLGTYIASGTNLNNLTDAGLYRWYGFNSSQMVNSPPAGYGAGVIKVYDAGYGCIAQEIHFITTNSNTKYIRIKEGSTWTSWRIIPVGENTPQIYTGTALPDLSNVKLGDEFVQSNVAGYIYKVADNAAGGKVWKQIAP